MYYNRSNEVNVRVIVSGERGLHPGILGLSPWSARKASQSMFPPALSGGACLR